MPSSSSEKGGLTGEALAVLVKDLRCELRTGSALLTIALFAIVTLAVVSWGIGGRLLEPVVQASLFWTVLYFASSVGLARTFVREEETGTALALHLTAEPLAVLTGKMLFNILLMLALAVLITPLYLGLLTVTVASPGPFLLLLAFGLIGLAGVSTLVAVIIARARLRGPLFGVLAFPILLPVLLIAVRGTELALSGAPPAELSGHLTGLAGFAGAAITISYLLFTPIWEG
jgi:heme exporter protein B